MADEQNAKLIALQEWKNAVGRVAQVKALIEDERQLRKRVIELFFPTPKEGTNTFELNAGYKLKLTYPLDRKVDEAAISSVLERVRAMQANPDELLDFKPSLNLKAYRAFQTLHPEAVKVFDEALTTKPGSASLELVEPKP